MISRLTKVLRPRRRELRYRRRPDPLPRIRYYR
jgi:hypothetical protein